MRLTFVLGTRPEVIKLAPLIRAARVNQIETQVILTGQHRNLALPLLQFFGIQPDIDLDIMRPGQSLTGITSEVLNQLSAHSSKIESDCLIVQGDTTSAFSAAYWAFCRKIPIAHIEAGLRTQDLNSPFPEEANRQLIGRIATFHFAPTLRAKNALLKEGVATSAIFNVGNTAIDALQYTLKEIRAERLPQEESLQPEILDFIEDHPLVLVTAHRRESFGPGFDGICNGILKLANHSTRNIQEFRIVYPVHPNPEVRGPVEKKLRNHPRIHLCNPLSYIGFVQLMERASVLLTDSGGVQEEGPTLRKPIVVMREKTERPEGVRAGFAKLVGVNPDKIAKSTLDALKKGSVIKKKNPYGDGRASERIIQILKKKFNN